MKNLTNLIIALFAMIALSGCDLSDIYIGGAGAETPVPARPYLVQAEYKYSNITETDVNLAMDYINNIRETGTMCGENWFPPVSPLVWDENLSKSASIKDADMIDNSGVQHNVSDVLNENLTKYGSSPDFANLIKTVGGYRWSVGENIAAGQPNMIEVMNAWHESPTHCRNMMTSSFKKVGFDKSRTHASKYGRYYTTHFSN